MLFELEAVGGPLAKRLARRRAGTESLDWAELAKHATKPGAADARIVWTQSAFSEYASAASFAGGITTSSLPASRSWINRPSSGPPLWICPVECR